VAAGYLLVALVAAAIAVFALQNSAATSVRFLAWTLDGLPLAAVALIALGVGLLTSSLPLGISRWRWRSRARSCQVRVAMLERALAERDEALLRREQRQEPGERPPDITS
jgi:uncharacterized integral membrane protein